MTDLVVVSWRVASARAAAVSRVLAKADLRPLPSGASWYREGIRVRGQTVSGAVRVTVDNDTRSQRDALCDEITQVLRAAGYQVENGVTVSADGTIRYLTVTKPTWNTSQVQK